ncbi:MAG: HlyD family efflux transporter periplasmic adaptor subunit, partial [Planctomycetota bacterium]
TDVELRQAKDEFSRALASVQIARDRLEQQQAGYELRLAESEQFCIRAPFDGVVVEFVKQPGEYVGPGESHVCTIANLDVLSVEFLVLRAYRGNLATGKSVEVVFTTSKRTVEGKIKYISPFPNGETGTYKVKALVNNADGSLSAGERCLLKFIDEPGGNDGAAGGARVTLREQ